MDIQQDRKGDNRNACNMSIIFGDGISEATSGPTKIVYKKEGDRIGISLIITDEQFLRQGYARRAMLEFLDHCDSRGLDVYLTPVATESHISKTMLRSFYASLGFARNSEREQRHWSSQSIEGHYAMRRLAGNKESASQLSPRRTNPF